MHDNDISLSPLQLLLLLLFVAGEYFASTSCFSHILGKYVWRKWHVSWPAAWYLLLVSCCHRSETGQKVTYEMRSTSASPSSASRWSQHRVTRYIVFPTKQNPQNSEKNIHMCRECLTNFCFSESVRYSKYYLTLKQIHLLFLLNNFIINLVIFHCFSFAFQTYKFLTVPHMTSYISTKCAFMPVFICICKTRFQFG